MRARARTQRERESGAGGLELHRRCAARRAASTESGRLERHVPPSMSALFTSKVMSRGGPQGVRDSTAGCCLGPAASDPVKLADTALEPVKWGDIAGWTARRSPGCVRAYQTSCQVLRKPQRVNVGPIHNGLWEVCRAALDARPQNADARAHFFEQNFVPVRIARLGDVEGLLTGYYEPIVQGSRFPNPEFHVPLYRRPRDLVAAGHKPGAGAFPNKGALIGRRNEKNEIVPYHDRGAIEAGALDGQKLEICWLKDPFEALAIQIQGSARVILEDGTPLRINYDSHNGYPYSSVGAS